MLTYLVSDSFQVNTICMLSRDIRYIGYYFLFDKRTYIVFINAYMHIVCSYLKYI